MRNSSYVMVGLLVLACGWSMEVKAAGIAVPDLAAAVTAACHGTFAKEGRCKDCLKDALEAAEKSFDKALKAGGITGKARDAAHKEFEKAEHATFKVFEEQCDVHCIATTCAVSGTSCGPLADGCGGNLDCGPCGPPACDGAGLANFSDDFNRADGPLVSPYLSGLPLPDATIASNQVCGLDHNAAMIQISQPPTSVTVDFDFSGPTTGMEFLAVAADQCSGDFVFAGQNAGTVLQIGTLGGQKVTSAPFVIQPNTTYHMSATFESGGAVSVRLTQGAALISSLSANLGRAFTFHQAGALMGRNANEGLNCADNLVVQVH